MWRASLEREHGLGGAGEDPSAIDTQRALLEHQTELHRVPVERGQRLEAVVAQRFPTRASVGREVFGEHGVGEQRHMPEDIVEDIGLLDVIELLTRADEVAGGKPTVGEVVEEHLIGDQHRHRHHGPAGERTELFIESTELGDAAASEVEPLQPLHERAAGTPREQRHLPRIEIVPDAVFGGGVVALGGLQPVLTEPRRFAQRRDEDIRGQRGDA